MTEEYLSRLFEALLESSAWRRKYPKVQRVEKEVACRQGIPDFVAATMDVPLATSSTATIARTMSLPACARLLSLLKPNAPRTEGYLHRVSGLSDPVFHRALRRLDESNLIEERGGARYVLSPLMAGLDGELWAFELKLLDWQRALYQSLQYQAFADRSFVVVPEEMSGRFEKNAARFERFGIGLIAIGNGDNHLREISPARKTRPHSRLHRFVAIGQLLSNAT
jgi:hypothetical protein